MRIMQTYLALRPFSSTSTEDYRSIDALLEEMRYNPEFALLHYMIDERKNMYNSMILPGNSKWIKTKDNPLDNGMWLNDTMHNFNQEGWINIHRLLNNAMQGLHSKINNYEIPEATNTNTIITKIIASINNIKTTTNDNNYFKLLQVVISMPKMAKIIKYYMEYLIMIIYKKKDQKTKNIPLTSFAINLSNMLIFYYCKKSFLLEKILNLMENSAPLKLTSEEKETLKIIINATHCNDHDQLCKIYNKLLDINLTDNKSINIINMHIMCMIYEQVAQGNHHLIKIVNEISKVDDITRMNAKRNLTEYQLQIGKLLIDFLIQEGLFIPHIQQITKNKTQHQLIVPPTILHLILSYNPQHPYLTKDYYLSTRSIKEKDFLDQVKNHEAYLMRANMSKKVHQNNDMRLEINDDCYLKKNTPLTYLVIDRGYLYDFLTLCIKFSEYKNNFPADKEKIYHYAMDHKDITNYMAVFFGYDLNMNLFNPFVYQMFHFAFDFSRMTDNKLYEEIMKSKIPNKQQMINMYNKIHQQKFFIIGLLNHAILYSLFKYFIQDGFIDSRGRYYLNGVFTNIQNFPIAKVLVKPFTVETTNISQDIRDIIAEQCSNEENNRLKIQCMNQRNFQKENNNLMKEYILSFFKPESLSKIQEILNDDNLSFMQVFELICMNVKKTKRLMIVHSIIMLQKEKNRESPRYPSTKYTGNYYELDATASGLQMTSLLLRSKNLAKMSNLIGTDKQDIYQQACKLFEKTLHAMNRFHDNQTTIASFIPTTEFKPMPRDKYPPPPHILNNIPLPPFLVFPPMNNPLLSDDVKMNLNVFKESLCTIDCTLSVNYSYLKKLNNTHDYLMAFFSANIKDSIAIIELINTLYIKFKETSVFAEWPDDKDELAVINVFIQRDFINLSSMPLLTVPHNDLKKLLLWRLFARLAAIQHNTKLSLFSINNRDLFKNAVMTYFYNSTSFGRKDDFIKVIQEARERSNFPVTTTITIIQKNINELATLIEDYFLHFIEERIEDTSKMKQFSELLALNGKKIIVKNKLFKMTFAPYKTETKTVQLTRYVRKREPQLNITIQTSEIDVALIKQKFNPNLIHTMDAFIAHAFIRKMYMINKNLKTHDCYIGNMTNHDNFMLSIPVFLKVLINDCYWELINTDYIATLKNIDEDIMKKILLLQGPKFNVNKINPNFVK